MRKILLFISFAILATSCGKEMPVIGAGNPEDEFRSCMKLSSKARYEDSVQCLEMLKARYPQSEFSEEAELKIGDAYFSKKDYLIAAESYAAFLNLHPRSKKADYAYYRMGYSYYKEAPKAIDRDQEYIEKAIDNLDIAVRRFPGSSYQGLASVTLASARRRVASRNYYIGRFYFRTGEYLAAIPRFLEVAEKYPDSGFADKALYKAIMACLHLKRVDEAKEIFGKLTTEYPNSTRTKIAERKLIQAVKSYQK